MIYQTQRKEYIKKQGWYKHTGNSVYGRRGLHKRLRKNAKQDIKRNLCS